MFTLNIQEEGLPTAVPLGGYGLVSSSALTAG